LEGVASVAAHRAAGELGLALTSPTTVGLAQHLASVCSRRKATPSLPE